MTVTEFATTPPAHRVRGARPAPPRGPGPAPSRRPRPRLPVPAAVGALVVLLSGLAVVNAGVTGALGADGVVTLLVFLVAVWMWIFAPVDDTYVALGAALALVIAGPVDTETFTRTLGDQIIWLLVGSFVIAAAVTASGLSSRVAARVLVLARTPRHLVHAVTATLLLTTFAVPSTSGRAALALPVFLALAAALRHRRSLVLTLALVFPAVILFSAVGSLLGAGAHLITSEIVRTATGAGFEFLHWMLLGLPLAVVWSHLAAEIALSLFTDRAERRTPLALTRGDLGADAGPLTTAQRRVTAVLVVVVAAWCTEPLHGIDPAIVAMTGALVAAAPAVGATTLPAAVKTVPWSLLLFMAATLCLGVALTGSGAAQWLADSVFGPLGGLGSSAAAAFVVTVVIVSLVSHLVVQSRSARSAVLIPLVVATAPTFGIDPAAAAFASTAAAGFCLTLTSSAKPVAMFAATDTVPGYDARHLLRLSAALAPVSLALVLACAVWLWPMLGLGLHL
ncbi:anion permease [Rhodococcus kroppenstedtii]|uniref:SLC13 family permease n=1 Tax=Rhodococcoides kroppenstedtii TaxID=293050 RepID=UPI001C9AA355|nr:SLC13 family permease [Rhodococcus kroppenstedtii]MBY6436146.1 anion permease [Rhodococcus kroppenstedtii]